MSTDESTQSSTNTEQLPANPKGPEVPKVACSKCTADITWNRFWVRHEDDPPGTYTCNACMEKAHEGLNGDTGAPEGRLQRVIPVRNRQVDFCYDCRKDIEHDSSAAAHPADAHALCGRCFVRRRAQHGLNDSVVDIGTLRTREVPDTMMP